MFSLVFMAVPYNTISYRLVRYNSCISDALYLGYMHFQEGCIEYSISITLASYLQQPLMWVIICIWHQDFYIISRDQQI